MIKYLPLVIFSIGLLIRLYKIDLPLLEFYPSRQIQTAEITRNLLREGFEILAPKVHYLGPGPGFFLVEFPLYNSAVAFLYSIFGLHEYLGRLLSTAGWAISFLFLWRLAVSYTSKFVANVALFFYSFSPLSILVSRSFQPDQWMLTTSIAAIYFLQRWVKFANWYSFYLSAVLASMAILLKIPAVIFTLVPITYLIFRLKNQVGGLQKACYYILVLVPSALWYLWATLVSKSGNPLEHNVALSNWFGFEVFLNPQYYANILGFEINLVLGPIGVLLFLIGLFLRLKPHQSILFFWLLGIIFYFLIFNKHNMTHEYYHLPFVPIAAIFAGIAIEKIYLRLNNFILGKRLLFLVLSLFVFISLFLITMKRAYEPIERFSFVPETALAIQRLTSPDALIIGSMDGGPSLVYYADRTGWGFEINREDLASQFAFYGAKVQENLDVVGELENLRKQGAEIFAVADYEQFETNKTFSEYMFNNYPVLDRGENYIIFDLQNKKDVH